MSKSRRKTLSHSELESFLNDINNDDSKNAMKSKDMNKKSSSNDDIKIHTTINVVDENRPNNILYYDNNIDAIKLDQPVNDNNVDMIRKFCKSLFNIQQYSIESIDIAKNINTKTNYNLLPTRLLYPNTFEHPSNTIAGKKALLVSLGPNLNETEKQRNLDVQTIESFTRCQVSKCNKRSSSYEYKDIDSGSVINEDEYEIRYLNYIYSKNKQTSKSRSYNNINKFYNMTLSSCLSADYFANSDASNDLFIADDFDDQISLPRSKRSRDRRVTLSPSTVKHSLHDCIDSKNSSNRRSSIDYNMINYLQYNDIDQKIINDDIDKENTSVNEVSNELVMEFADELDAILSDDNLSTNRLPNEISTVQSIGLAATTSDTSEDNKIDIIDDTFNTNQTNGYVDLLDVSINNDYITDCKLDLNLFSSSNSFTSVDLIGLQDFEDILQSNQPISENKLDISLDNQIANQPATELINTLNPIIDSPIDEDVILSDEELLHMKENEAYVRMCIRFDQLRWKYHWEVVSVQACIKAKSFQKI